MKVPKTPEPADFTDAAVVLAGANSSCSIEANILVLVNDARLSPLEREVWRQARWAVHKAASLLIDAASHATKIARLKAWVADLQARLTVNCVYCGLSYGPRESTPVSMADILKAHIEVCPDHPMSTLKAEVARLLAENHNLREMAADAKWSLEV